LKADDNNTPNLKQNPFKSRIMASINPVATNGFAKGALYDQHRPTYPAEAVSSLLAHLGLADKRGGKIVDLGAGTGKFTEALAAREEGYEVVAVEPLESMRDILAAKGLKGVVTKDGTATDTGLEAGWADAVIIAQV
jgi:tRNA1(Val) A37 N6-methylase TrmN6